MAFADNMSKRETQIVISTNGPQSDGQCGISSHKTLAGPSIAKNSVPKSHDTVKDELTTTLEEEDSYSIFTPRMKRLIIVSASTGSFISPLTTNIYLPAIASIAESLNVSISAVNLTITVYMIFQGLTPLFVGNFSDSSGRRPAYILGLIVFLVANIGLAVQNNYVGLMVLRCLQAIGSSGLDSVCSGVVSDCITSAERGSYIGYMSVGPLLGPSLAPFLGGTLSHYLGWHSIFYALAIFGGVFLVTLSVFFPETCRKLVGNGSIAPPVWGHSLLTYLRARQLAKAGNPAIPERLHPTEINRQIKFPNPLASLRMLVEKESAFLIWYFGVVYAGYYIIITSLPYQYRKIYGFNDFIVGLCYIPISVGGALATISNAKWDPIDRNYRRHAKRLGLPLGRKIQHDLSKFPVERARLEILIPLLAASVVIVAIYGWMLSAHVSVAGPFVLLFFLGFCTNGMTKCVQVLLIDLKGDQAASITASFNFLRSLLAAGAVAGTQPMIHAIGNGWACTLIASSWVLLSPALLIVLWKGPQWRAKKAIVVMHRSNEPIRDTEPRGPRRSIVSQL